MAETTQSVDIPSTLKPYATSLLENAFNYANPNTTPYYGLGSYKAATGETPFAQINPLQQQAYQASSNLGPSNYLSQAGNLLGYIAQQGQQYTQPTNYYSAPQAQSMGLGYLSTFAPNLQNYQMQGPGNISAQNVYAPSLQNYQMQGPGNISAPNLQNYQMQGPGNIYTQDYTGSNVGNYMSPYMQNVVEQQKQGAIQDYARSIPGMGSNAARVGALGGTRNALVQAEARRNLGRQLGDIQATGSQTAFQNAQQQFNTQQQANLQAQQANQNMGYNVGQQNLQSLLNTQQLGANLGMQAAQANQNMGYNVGLQNLNALLNTQQLGAQQGLSAQQANQSAGLQAAQANQNMGYNVGLQNLQSLLNTQQLGANLGMQSQQANQSAALQNQQQALNQLQNLNQYGLSNAQNMAQYGLSGAQLGLQGLAQQLSAAGQLGSLGQNQFNQQLEAIKNQTTQGQNLYGIEQNVAGQKYADYQAAMQYPMTQMNFLSGILGKIPTGTNQAVSSSNTGLDWLTGIGSLLSAYKSVMG